MSEFVASSGWRVAVKEKPGVAEIEIIDSHSESNGQVLKALPSQVDALREFFLAERDAELGRWRSKEQPTTVVYTDPNDKNAILVINESGPEWAECTRRDAERMSDPVGVFAVATEFFAAHPERKPWHDAQPGEAWVITIDSYMVDAPAVMEDSGLFRTKDGQGWTRNHEQITAGRRIWPEGN